jgi:hypothetical protein
LSCGPNFRPVPALVVVGDKLGLSFPLQSRIRTLPGTSVQGTTKPNPSPRVQAGLTTSILQNGVGSSALEPDKKGRNER